MLVNAPSHGALTLNADGSFAYQPAAGYSGPDSFSYTANDVDTGRASNVATVSITVVQVGYGFLNVKNLPPAAGVTFKPSSRGTLVDFEWKFTMGGAIVNSADAQPSVTIVSPSGSSRTYTPTACDDFQFVYQSSDRIVGFRLGAEECGGRNVLRDRQERQDGQRFPETGPGFPVVFTRY